MAAAANVGSTAAAAAADRVEPPAAAPAPAAACGKHVLHIHGWAACCMHASLCCWPDTCTQLFSVQMASPRIAQHPLKTLPLASSSLYHPPNR